uniref:MRG domain-containing protein n=1 Tax=Steinernema glaseri TaxID=37863 RepID=A0A1I8AE44_9BILA
QPKEDKFVVQFVEVSADATDPQAPFKAGGQQGEVVIPVKADYIHHYSAENSTSPPSSPQSSSTVDSPIILPEVVVEDHKVVYDVEPLLTFVRDILNGPCLPLKTIHGVRYAPLQRFHMAFYHLFDGVRPTVIHETNLINMTMVIREMETVIQRSAKFLMSCEEFCGLPTSDKLHHSAS